MIERLSELTLVDFRGYRGRLQLPLDAEVVLVYGENGAGKSNLMAAIEYALTGVVSDLVGLEKDYPRCLTHIDADAPAEVALSAQGLDGETLAFSAGPSASSHLPTADARHFVDRCYLSQHRLARLLDIYQETDSETSEETLVSFLRELLGLSRLEALTEGLHEAGDIRRLRKRIPEYDQLRHRVDRAKSDIKAVRAEVNDLTSILQNVLDTLSGEVRAANISAKVTSDPQTLKGLVSELEKKTRAWKESASVKTVEKWRDKVERAQSILPEDSGPSSEKLFARIKDQEARQKKLKAILVPIVEQGTKLNLVSPDLLEGDVDRNLQLLTRAAETELSKTQSELRAAKAAQKRRRTINKRLKELEDELTSLEADLPSRSTRIDRLISLLAEARDLIDGERCPVCTRDFSEVDEGPLETHIGRHLEELTDESARLQKLVKRRAQVLREFAEAQATQEQIPSETEETIEAAEVRTERLEHFLSAVQDVELTLKACVDGREELGGLREALAIAKRRDEVRSQIVGDLEDAFVELGLEEPPPENIHKFLNLLSEVITEQQQNLDENEKTLQTALESCRRAHSLAINVEAETKRLNFYERSAKILTGGVDTVQQEAIIARQVRDAASEAKRRLIQEAFTESLNRLWTDLFQRLANESVFSPSLETEVLSRGRIRAGMHARHGDDRPFEHLRAVLSAGNVNTAALSLFLALHLVHEPRSRVLVLDDPVQSMDDLHAVEFASLLDLIVKQAGRQLVLAVHEEPLFDYLADQFAPSSLDARLILVKVKKAGRTSEVEFSVIEGSADETVLPPGA